MSKRLWFASVVVTVVLTVLGARAQDERTLVTSHDIAIQPNGNVHIDFALEAVPEQAILAFDLRFQPRTV